MIGRGRLLEMMKGLIKGNSLVFRKVLLKGNLAVSFHIGIRQPEKG